MNGIFDVSIRNFRSVLEAHFSVSNIALITGPNNSGKTSVLYGVAACFLGDRKVFAATAKDHSSVVSDGAEQASIALTGERWDRAISWPGDITGNDIDMPTVDQISLGMVDPARDFSKPKWGNFVRSIAPSTSKLTFADVKKAIEDELGAEQDVEDRDRDYVVIKDTLDGGFDATEIFCKSKALNFKRAWESVTGQKFGSDKSDGWKAEGLLRIDPSKSMDDMIQDRSDLTAELADCRSRAAIVGEQVEDLEDEVNKLQIEQRQCGRDLEQLRSIMARAEKELSFYPQTGPLACPDCGAQFHVKGGTVSKHVPDGRVYRSQVHLNLFAQKEIYRRDYDKAAALNGTLLAKIEAQTAMLTKIADIGEGGRDLEIVETELEQAEKDCKARETTIAAETIFHRWKLFSAAERHASASGLRFKATRVAVESLEPRINEIAAHVFPGYDVAFEVSSAGVNVTFDGRSYESMTWNGQQNSFALGIQILCQLLSLDTWSSDCPIIIDCFDLLEIKRRGAILKFLADSGRPAIIGQTTSKKLGEDKLAARGVGKTYYINDGVLEPV